MGIIHLQRCRDPDRMRAMRLRNRIFLMSLVVLIGIFTWWFASSSASKWRYRSNTTKKVAVELSASISSYYADYDYVPVAKDVSADWSGTTVANPEFLAVLSARADPRMNPKKHDYLDGFKQAKPLRGGKFVDGIDYSDPSSPTLVDPWGQPYNVIMDTNEDGKITLPFIHGTSADVFGKRSVVYSTGEPNADGTPNSDPAKFIKSF